MIHGTNYDYVKLNNNFGSYNGDLKIHLIEHELGFLWSCMIKVSFYVQCDHLDQIR